MHDERGTRIDTTNAIAGGSVCVTQQTTGTTGLAEAGVISSSTTKTTKGRTRPLKTSSPSAPPAIARSTANSPSTTGEAPTATGQKKLDWYSRKDILKEVERAEEQLQLFAASAMMREKKRREIRDTLTSLLDLV